MLQEFDDSYLVSKIVSDFVRIEEKEAWEKSRMTDEHFDELHRLYLLTLKKPKAKATFQGKYVLICFDENDTHNTRQRYLLESASDKAVRVLKNKHEDHNYLLLHQSRAKKYGIKRTNPIWRNLA
ncbi:MAG: hypothetical protein ACREBJ_04260 [Nitrosotalea sp.]